MTYTFRPTDRTPQERAIESCSIGTEETQIMTIREIKKVFRTDKYGK